MEAITTPTYRVSSDTRVSLLIVASDSHRSSFWLSSAPSFMRTLRFDGDTNVRDEDAMHNIGLFEEIFPWPGFSPEQNHADLPTRSHGFGAKVCHAVRHFRSHACVIVTRRSCCISGLLWSLASCLPRRRAYGCWKTKHEKPLLSTRAWTLLCAFSTGNRPCAQAQQTAYNAKVAKKGYAGRAWQCIMHRVVNCDTRPNNA